MNTFHSQQQQSSFFSWNRIVQFSFLIILLVIYSIYANGQTFSPLTDNAIDTVVITVDDAPVYNSIAVEGEEDWYKFKTLVTGEYVFTTSADYDLNHEIFIYEDDHTSLITYKQSEYHDAFSASNIEVTLTLSANKWYFVKINGHNVDEGELYNYYFNIISGPMLYLNLGAQPLNSSIDPAGEEDWFTIPTPEGLGKPSNYVIQTYGNTDTYLSLYRKSVLGRVGWELLSEDDNSGAENNAMICTEELPYRYDTYYVRVNGANTESTGPYSINVNYYQGNKEVYNSTSNDTNRQAMAVGLYYPSLSKMISINSISIYHNGGEGNVLLGVYSDDAGIPSTLLGVTAPTAINSTAGWQTVPLTTPTPVQLINPYFARVWLSFVFDNNPGVSYTTGTPTSAQSAETWSAGMPSSFGAESSVNKNYSMFCSFSTFIPSLSVSPTSISLESYSGASGTFDITSTTSWKIEGGDGGKLKLKVSPVSGIGNATITVTAKSFNKLNYPYPNELLVRGDGWNVEPKYVTVTQEPEASSDYVGLGFTDWNWEVSTGLSRKAMPVTLNEKGFVNNISIYHNGGTGNVLLGVYSDDSGLPKSQLGITAITPVNTVEGWQTVPLISPITVTSGQTVWLAWVFENNVGQNYTTGTPGGTLSVETWSSGMPTDFGATSASDTIYSIYCAYNPVIDSTYSEYMFEDPDGTTVFDSNDSIDGIIVNTAARVNGVRSGGMEFTGSGYISLGNSFSDNARNELTLSAWIKPDSNSNIKGGEGIITGGFMNCYGLYIFPDTKGIAFIIGGTSSTSNTWAKIDNVNNLWDGNWHHLAVTYNGSQKIIYLDGVVILTVDATGRIYWEYANWEYPYSLLIGAAWDGGFYKGFMDEVRIYNYALTGAQVGELYNLVDPKPEIVPPVVTAFTIPAFSSSLIVPVGSFTATDNIAVTGFKITDTTDAPKATDDGWTSTAPASYTFNSEGTKTLYSWAKDASGNVSNFVSGTVIISDTDTVVVQVSDGPIRYNLSDDGEDWYKFKTYADGEHIIKAYNCTEIFIFESDGTTLISHQVGDTGWRTRLTVNLKADSWYYVKIINDFVYYDFCVIKGPIVVLQNKTQIDATLDVAGEGDWYSFTDWNGNGNYSENFTFQTFGNTDTYITIYTDVSMGGPGAFEEVVSDDNSGFDNNAMISTKAYFKYNRYYVRIGGSNASITGPYSIVAEIKTYLSVSDTFLTIGPNGGAGGTFEIRGNTGWNITNNADWLDVTPVSGMGFYEDNTVHVYAKTNNWGTSPRTATLTISDGLSPSKTVTVNQDGVLKSFGNTEVYSLVSTGLNRSAIPVTFSEDGVIQSLTIYHNGGTGNFLLGVYADDSGFPGTLLGVTASTPVNSTEGWQKVPLISPVRVSLGQTVWLAWVFENSVGQRYTSGTPGCYLSSLIWADGLPENFDPSSHVDKNYSIYCLYTPDVYHGDIFLSSQAEVDAFNYINIRGQLIISGSDITNLKHLNSLTSVGQLIIGSNPSLTSLLGLENLTWVGLLDIYDNDTLTSLSGLDNLTTTGDELMIRNNDALTSLSGLSNLTSVGLSLLIEGNSALTSLSGLDNLTSASDLVIIGNSALTSLSGLDNLTSTHRIRIYENSVLTIFCALYPVLSTGGLISSMYEVYNNASNPTQQEIIDEGSCNSPTYSEYLFEESGGTTVFDSNGSNDGIIMNTVKRVDGVGGSGLEFTGAGYISLGQSFGENVENEVTLSAWINPTITTGNYQGIIMHGGPNTDSYALYIYPNAKEIGFKTSGTSNAWATVNNVSKLWDGNWHLLTATYNGSKKIIYLDNEAIINVDATGTIVSGLGYNLLIGAGRDEESPTLLYQGLIDEARIYNYALTNEQVGELYNLINPICLQHFHPVWEGTFGFEHMNINITGAQLDGLNLETGDEIGVFDGNTCVGFGRVEQTIDQQNLLNIVVSQDDSSGNGYTSGNKVLYTVWDCSESKEYHVQNIKCFDNQQNLINCTTFATGTTTFALLSGYTVETQQIALYTGWNIMSIRVMPENENLKNILQPLIDDGKLNKVMDETGKVIEDWGYFGGWQNTIGGLKNTKGYKINVSSSASLEVAGVPMNFPFKIPLKAGWNIISWPSPNEQNGKAVFQTLIDESKLKKVMNEAGKIIEDWGFFGGWQNYIGNFKPGEGYKVNVTSDCILTIDENGIKSEEILPELLASIHFIPVFKGNGTDHMNINLLNLAESGFLEGDEIGIFDGNRCVGSAQISNISSLIDNQNSISIPVSASDDNESKNGYIEGNSIIVKLFRNGIENALTLHPINRSKVVFEKGESLFAMIDFITGLERFNTHGSTEITCYPNPFSDKLRFEFVSPKSVDARIIIYDMTGRIVKTIFDQPIEGGVNYESEFKPKSTINGIYFYKVIFGEMVYNGKVMFMKK